ncbi:MAG: hypothetical protein GYA23_02995 [Methanomicrobiales archaeon]|nr:hypothetical protein [Methanomicrobiales archaeon]
MHNVSEHFTVEQYQIVAWYCEDRETCRTAESVLTEYLEGQGTLSVGELDFPEQRGISQGIIVQKIPVLRFESTTTSGYFMVIEKPLGSMKGDKIFLYYNTQRSSLGSSQELILKEMVVETFSERTVPSFAAFG